MIQGTTLFYLTLGLTVVSFLWRQWLRFLNYRYLKRHRGEIPEVLRGAFLPEDMEKIEVYTLARMRFATYEGIFSFVVFVWWVFGGGFLWVYHLVVGWGLSFVWTGIVLTWLSTFLFLVIGIPWDLYETFVLEQRFGFNTMTFGTWLADQVKGMLLSVILELPLLWVVLSVIEGLPTLWWFVGWGVYALFEVLIIYIAPYVIEPLFNKYEPLEEEYGEKIRQWAEEQGVSVKAVLKMDASRRTRHSNAYFTGLGKVKRIVVFDTLLENFSLEEILAILSHELGHWKKHHVLKQVVFSLVVSLVGMFVVFKIIEFRWFSQAFGVAAELAFSWKGFYPEVFFLGVFFSGFGVIVGPCMSWLSRRREREADAYAVRVMRGVEHLQSALIKLYKENLSPFHVHPLVARLTYSHPPLLERLAFLASEGKKITNDTAS